LLGGVASFVVWRLPDRRQVGGAGRLPSLPPRSLPFSPQDRGVSKLDSDVVDHALDVTASPNDGVLVDDRRVRTDRKMYRQCSARIHGHPTQKAGAVLRDISHPNAKDARGLFVLHDGDRQQHASQLPAGGTPLRSLFFRFPCLEFVQQPSRFDVRQLNVKLCEMWNRHVRLSPTIRACMHIGGVRSQHHDHLSFEPPPISGSPRG